MIYGIGIDLVEVVRFRDSYGRFGERLAQRILGEAELDEFRLARQPVRFLAMRFAAKEACSKALGTGFRDGVSPRRIRVQHDHRGKPSLSFAPALDARLAAHGISTSHVSMADEREYAVAVVVLETSTGNTGPLL